MENKINRQEVIGKLMKSLYAKNIKLVVSGTVTKEDLFKFLSEQEERYTNMTDLELVNIMVINF